MTTVQAIKALNKLIQHRQELRDTFSDKNKPWNRNTGEFPAETANVLSEFMTNEIEYLTKIRAMLKTPNNKKCKHLKKYQDIDPQGKKYCTNCNETLE